MEAKDYQPEAVPFVKETIDERRISDTIYEDFAIKVEELIKHEKESNKIANRTWCITEDNQLYLEVFTFCQTIKY